MPSARNRRLKRATDTSSGPLSRRPCRRRARGRHPSAPRPQADGEHDHATPDAGVGPVRDGLIAIDPVVQERVKRRVRVRCVLPDQPAIASPDRRVGEREMGIAAAVGTGCTSSSSAKRVPGAIHDFQQAIPSRPVNPSAAIRPLRRYAAGTTAGAASRRPETGYVSTAPALSSAEQSTASVQTGRGCGHVPAVSMRPQVWLIRASSGGAARRSCACRSFSSSARSISRCIGVEPSAARRPRAANCRFSRIVRSARNSARST